MLIAYLDEIGEPGAFVSRDHPRFNTSPAFGYAGFVIPDVNAHDFGMRFTHQKRTLFSREVAMSDEGTLGSASVWEKKGSEFFAKQTHEKNPERLRVFDALVDTLRSAQGNLFYYADEKPIGTPGQTRELLELREQRAMQETLNRLARHAAKRDEHIFIIMDLVNEHQRTERTQRMYAHVYSRMKDFREMRRIVEPPMHLDSKISSNIQFADWVAAIIGRAVDYQLIEGSAFKWVTDPARVKFLTRHPKELFTYESKLHFHERVCDDLNHRSVFSKNRAVYPPTADQYIDTDLAQKMWKMAYSVENRKRKS